MNSSLKKDTPLLISLLLSLIAVGVQAYLTTHYYDLKYGGATGDSICNVSSYINCDAVTASKYASLFGIPLALWATITNLIAVLLFGLARFNLTQDSEKTARYAFLISGFILLMSIVMGTISFGVIGNLCLFCASAYVLSVLSFGSAWFSVRHRASELITDIKDLFTSQRGILGCLVAIPVLSFVGNSMILDGRGFNNLSKIIEEKVAYWQVAPTQTFGNQGLMLQKGQGEPVMTIVEFADFRCPHCREAYPSLHAFAESHPDVRLIFKTFPLDGVCNPALGHDGDGISCALAEINYCSEKMAQKGWITHHFIYDHQEDFHALPLDEAADKICQGTGISACDELKKCAKSDETLDVIKAMAAEGAKAQIQGTPSVFVNSKLLQGGQLLPILDAAYKKIKNP